MAHVISDECVSCGACEAECPVGAISQGADHYEIDADACVDCGACAAQCPTGAIYQTKKKSIAFLPGMQCFFSYVRRLLTYFACSLCYSGHAKNNYSAVTT